MDPGNFGGHSYQNVNVEDIFRNFGDIFGGGQAGGGGGGFDPFESFFGGGGGGRRQQTRGKRGTNLRIKQMVRRRLMLQSLTLRQIAMPQVRLKLVVP
jgi:hypothetical protein